MYTCQLRLFSDNQLKVDNWVETGPNERKPNNPDGTWF